MAIRLEEVVPVGRTLDEYIKIFNLTDADLKKSILGIGDGPASFNAEGSRLGYRITSVDPIYEFNADQIRQRFDKVIDDIIEQVRNTPTDWVWAYHTSPEDLRKNRERALTLFCEDYDQGKQDGRYELGELPHLIYEDNQYELGLCSHLLFLYSDHLDEQFHIESILEGLRVCQEVRIFPLLTLMLDPSPHLQKVLERLTQEGYSWKIQQSGYELQRGGNQFLKITR
jgi:hypothetical protein